MCRVGCDRIAMRSQSPRRVASSVEAKSHCGVGISGECRFEKDGVKNQYSLGNMPKVYIW
jgi:hypothetical protein